MILEGDIAVKREARRKKTRRQFLKWLAITAGGLAIYPAARLLGVVPDTAAQGQQLTPRTYLPLVLSRFPPAPTEVVHVHAAEATHWDFSTGWYGEYVRQDVVDEMVERGLMDLTGTASVTEAWATILPGYVPGQKIAVKVNFNNCRFCGDIDNAIDALIEPVNALMHSLVQAGVRAEDIWVYDSSRRMPRRFYDRRRYPQARYIDRYGCADEQATFNHVDDSLRVSFSHPSMVTDRWLTDLLYEATYVINMPILKKHGTHPVTLGFKNHFGSLDNLGGAGDDNPHPYINPDDNRYSPNFSPLVEIYANPNIAGKTVLTVGDGLFGAPSVGATPVAWNTFSGAPNSLLFSHDPVAIDCVMCDLLRAEWGLDEATYDYLILADGQRLGTFERRDPWGSGYTRLDYSWIEV